MRISAHVECGSGTVSITLPDRTLALTPLEAAKFLTNLEWAVKAAHSEIYMKEKVRRTYQ